MTAAFRTETVLVAVIPALLAAHGPSRAEAADRPMSTDRPDRTESPYSVPRGMTQIELDAVTYGEFSEGGVTLSTLGIGVLNLKYGVSENADVQLVFSPYTRSKLSAGPFEDIDSGTGSIGARFKFNLTGNDTGDRAVALLPYVLVPTRGEHKADNTVYGVVVPVTLPLEGNRALGAMAGVERLGDTNTFGIVSATLSSPFGDGGWGGFVELFVAMDGLNGDDVQAATFDVGVVFSPRDGLQFDAGTYLGLASDAEDWRIFAGLSARR